MKLQFTKYIVMLCMGSVFLQLFSSCGKEEEPATKASIGFNSEWDKGRSRAPMVEDAEDEDLVDFCVWGDYTEEGSVTPVFTNQLVQRSGDNWVYAPEKYWVLTASHYDFSAYSPHGAGTPVVYENALTAIDFDSKAKQVDLMMARVTVGSEGFEQVVNLPFKHVLAAVSFTFQLKEGHNYVNTYKVTKVQLSSLFTQGRFTLNADNSIAGTTKDDRGAANAVTSFTGSAFTTDATMVSDPLFVIPQKGTAKLSVTLEINGKEVTLTPKDLTMDWEMGRLYNYQVVVDPLQDITITVQTIPWDKPIIQDVIVSETK